ncbi:hypothetical protein [Polymorphobacter fuscus]|uniref:hypothetical protein n=1 Tax=Sandarakinorhabdus fusca TaxID=1439888 RepID=UPI001295E9B7|nr:hypothetical protein [Polymorphobacter fuscus]NJC08380.1 hypothetical protein [Polymorphobacter fuscus]
MQNIRASEICLGGHAAASDTGASGRRRTLWYRLRLGWRWYRRSIRKPMSEDERIQSQW